MSFVKKSSNKVTHKKRFYIKDLILLKINKVSRQLNLYVYNNERVTPLEIPTNVYRTKTVDGSLFTCHYTFEVLDNVLRGTGKGD